MMTTMMTTRVKSQNQESTTINDDEIRYPDSEPEVSSSAVPTEQRSRHSCESEVTSANLQQEFGMFKSNGMIKMEKGSYDYEVIRNKFLSGVGGGRLFGNKQQATVVAIHKNSFSGLSGQARLEAFKIFSNAKRNLRGDSNLKYGWYGGSREEISQILSHGFDSSRVVKDGCYQFYGSGVYLASADFSIDGALSSSLDENGLTHILLCRVILGKQEVIEPGSKQMCPSSNEFDSGVDNLSKPRRYIVWNPYMNSHILPFYIISFRTMPSAGFSELRTRVAKPTSPWMRFEPIIAILTKILPAPKMQLLMKHHRAYLDRKIPRGELIAKLRQLAGDRLLIDVIRYYQDQVHRRAATTPVVNAVHA